MSVKDLVEKAIANNQIAIFSKSYCPYCRRAKNLVKENYGSATTVIYELDEMDNGREIQDYLATKTKQRTVPNIFIGQKHIGGSDDIMEQHDKGNITPLLK